MWGMKSSIIDPRTSSLDSKDTMGMHSSSRMPRFLSSRSLR